VRRLVTIPISHFCEKARWALDRAGLDYAEDRHVQGIHRLFARRAGGGPTVPVLVADGRVHAESDDILRYADEHVDEERRLFPADAELRAEVDALCRRLDDGLGPDGRRLMYVHMLALKPLTLPFNNQGVPAWEAVALKAMWPAATRFIGRELGITSTTASDDERRVREAFDAIAEQLADGRPYLLGDRFTAADLTFASLAAAAVVPPEYGVRLPQPEELPEPVAGLIRSFREHPAGAYALRLFAAERHIVATHL
jgi:glutathione S-transferase